MKTKFIFPGSILLISLVILLHSCKKDHPAFPPQVLTTPATEVTYTTAVSGGEVTNEGGDRINSLEESKYRRH